MKSVGQKFSRKPTEPHLNALRNRAEVILSYFA